MENSAAEPTPAAVDMKSVLVAKEVLVKFIQQCHQRASQITGWVSNLEPPTNPQPSDKAQRLLGLSVHGSVCLRFVRECKAINPWQSASTIWRCQMVHKSPTSPSDKTELNS